MRFTPRLWPALLAAALLFSTPAARAQGTPGSGGPEPGQPTAVPIDGGATLLLAGGAAYALARLRRR